MTRSFQDKLSAAAERNQSLVCVGLDPDPSLMPVKDIFEFNRAIIDATRDLVCAYKPNVAFYDALGIDGHRALLRTVEYIPDDIPAIGDAKRGDVPSTSVFHAKAMFDVWGFDAATINPYGGRDAVEPFLQYTDKGVFVWCRSTNAGAGEIQDLVVTPPGEHSPRPLYEWIAVRASQWNDANNVGLVVGATYPDELKRVRDLAPHMPILIPGVGAQLGPLEKSVVNGVDSNGRNAIINVSRTIIYASNERAGYPEAARRMAQDIRGHINGHLGFLGRQWGTSTPKEAERHVTPTM